MLYDYTQCSGEFNFDWSRQVEADGRWTVETQIVNVEYLPISHVHTWCLANHASIPNPGWVD